MARLTYSVTEVADLLGISRSKAYELVAEGAIPVVPLQSRRRLVPRRVIDELLGQTADQAGEGSSRFDPQHRAEYAPESAPQP